MTVGDRLYLDRPRGPFDRMLIAQSQMEDLPLVSVEEVFEGYGVNRLWW